MTDFVKNVSDDMPVFLGSGPETSAVEDLARKHRRKAWFAVMKDVPESLMVDFDFDKTPALVGLHPNSRSVLSSMAHLKVMTWGTLSCQISCPWFHPLPPLERQAVKRNQLPVAVGVIDSRSDSAYRSFIPKLKAAAPANRAFAYFDISPALAFVEPFGVVRASVLPTMVIWDGETHFAKSDDVEAFVGADAEARLTQFLQDFRDEKLKLRPLLQPPLLHLAKKNLFGGPTLFSSRYPSVEVNNTDPFRVGE